MTKKRDLRISLDLKTFQYMEALVVGLHRQKLESGEITRTEYQSLIDKSISVKHDDFGKGVSDLLEHVALVIASGVGRGGSWERDIILSLTGWDGTFVPDSLGSLVDIPDLEKKP